MSLFTIKKWTKVKEDGKKLYIYNLLKKSIPAMVICYTLYNFFLSKLYDIKFSFYQYMILDLLVPTGIIIIYVIVLTHYTWKLNIMAYNTNNFNIKEYKKTYTISTLIDNCILISSIVTFNILNLFSKNFIYIIEIFIFSVMALLLLYISVFKSIWKKANKDLEMKLLEARSKTH